MSVTVETFMGYAHGFHHAKKSVRILRMCVLFYVPKARVRPKQVLITNMCAIFFSPFLHYNNTIHCLRVNEIYARVINVGLNFPAFV